RVTFQDSLKPNTTYTLDFADAIVDNNEGNPLGFYRYVFSTGPQLDSMELGGQVIDMQTQLPVLGATVMFYQNTADSVPLTDLPSYVAKTDSAGMFRVTNIKDDTYRVMAIDDARGNYLFVPSETKVGFIDSLIQTISFPMTVYDTIHPDTTVDMPTSFLTFMPLAEFIPMKLKNAKKVIFLFCEISAMTRSALLSAK
ncbi:MAG: hypothetical protein J6A60_07570, partial [Clostridia bacterium]|nr:hypothetical protein [Clostridia bacterium]